MNDHTVITHDHLTKALERLAHECPKGMTRCHLYNILYLLEQSARLQTTEYIAFIELYVPKQFIELLQHYIQEQHIQALMIKVCNDHEIMGLLDKVCNDHDGPS